MSTTWMFSKEFEPSVNMEGFGKIFAVCDSCLASKAAFSILGTMMIGGKLDNGGKEWFHSLRTGCFSGCKKGKRNIVEDHYFDNQILVEGLSTIRTMAQKTFLLQDKISLLGILQWATCFVSAIQTLRTNELEIKFLWDRKRRRSFSFQKMHRFGIQSWATLVG